MTKMTLLLTKWKLYIGSFANSFVPDKLKLSKKVKPDNIETL